MRRTVFWKVAGVLVGAQVATALLAVALSAVLARERSRDLLDGTLRLRLDAVAEEVEQRADIDPFGALALPERLRQDLALRFPDPVVVLDADGVPLGRGAAAALPPAAERALVDGQIALAADGPPTWALAPLLGPDGLPAGALWLPSFDATIAEETADTRAAFVRALWTVSLLAAAVALALGAFLTSRLVRPLRRITGRVERLGDGDLAARLPAAADDEFGRLARAVNEMAERVEASLDTLRQADRLRRELVANVGHDLRTPLAALGGFLEEAERHAGAGRSSEAGDALDAARRQQGLISDLVADLFELSVLERPAAPLRLAPVPLGELLADAARTHTPAFDAAGVAFALDAPAGLPTVEADAVRLLRLLGNLLDNARRHTPAGGAVTLAARPVGDAVEIAVRDTGSGIAPEVLPTVFERYAQGSGPRTRGDGGTGLGLAIARAVARAHGGTLEAQSAVGEGSAFTLRLPAG